MNKVSIIIPVYNVEVYLDECIQSVLSQTYENYEVILVDDGSTDTSGMICDSYTRRDKIKVLHKENGGLSSARNAGIEVANGEFLFFVDSDDYLSSDALESMMKIYAATMADIVIAQYSSQKSDLTIRTHVPPYVFDSQTTLKMLLQEKISPSACAKLYKTALFKDIRFPCGMIYEDYATTPKVIGIANTIAIVNACVYYYRNNPQSITRVTFSDRRMQYFDVANSIIEYLEKDNKQLVKWANMRNTRYAISFYKQISQSGFSDENIEKYLITQIKKYILPYCLITRYSILSRIYGVLIVISPKLSRRVMQLLGV